jgi:hypothetical protein
MASAEFSLEQKLDALSSALATGAITQTQYNAQYALLTATPDESFSWEKFFEGMLSVLNPINWAKDFASLFNIRKLLIMAAIGAALWFGLRDRIPSFDFGPNSLNGKSFSIVLPGTPDTLKLDSAGHVTIVDTKTGKTVGTVEVKDIKGLNAAIHPIGFELKPFIVAGAGAGTAGGHFDVGAGAHVFHIYNWQTDGFVTNSGAYLGESYRLSKFLGGNTSVGVGAGPQWKGGIGAIVYATIDF